MTTFLLLIIVLPFALGCTSEAYAQSKTKHSALVQKQSVNQPRATRKIFASHQRQPVNGSVLTPRLIVMISYDQFRGDYIDNFSRFVGKKGFERMRKEGANFSRCMYTHANTMTGPGHSILMTGHNPNNTGIPSNDFCDKSTGECMYCCEDNSNTLSPANLQVQTFSETLRRRTPNSKTVGIAIKDRAAILMAGHSPNAALWMDFKTHQFVTSPYYETPSWLPKLNERVRPESHAGAVWSASIPERLSPAVDDQVGEGTFSTGRRTFPYTIPDVQNKNFFIDYMRTPFNMVDLFDASKAVIEYEDLGAKGQSDVLCIGVSTTDFIGHSFGPDSREVQEMYVACDRELGNFIDYLDKRIGRKGYVLVISSDHGVAPIPEVIKNAAAAQHTTVDAGRISERAIRQTIDSALNEKFGADSDKKSWCREIFEPNIYLNDTLLQKKIILKSDAVRVAANALRSLQGIGICVERDSIEHQVRPSNVSPEIWTYINNSFSAGRSGDILIYPKQYWIFGGAPASHGTPYEYDRHVPLMWLGYNIKAKADTSDVSPTDIYRALSELCNVYLDDPNTHALDLQGGTRQR